MKPQPKESHPARTPDLYFDPCAFGLPEPGFYGNLGRNTVTGPGLANFDFSVVKNIALTESKSLQFRGDFNLPNHPIWNPPGRTLRNPDYGVITSTHIDSRQIQFALKVVF